MVDFKKALAASKAKRMQAEKDLTEMLHGKPATEPAKKPSFNIAKKNASHGLKKALQDKSATLKNKPKSKFKLGVGKRSSNSKATPDVEVAQSPAPLATSTEPVVGEPSQVTATGSLNNTPEAKPDKYVFSEQPESFAPEVIEEMQAAFETLRESLSHPEIVSDAIGNILKYLQSHEGLNKVVEPADYGVMVRALRMSYGTTITKKQGNKAKKVKNEQTVDEIVSELDGMSFEV